eukprot:9487725-Pyramimonas_sp.AAC.1
MLIAAAVQGRRAAALSLPEGCGDGVPELLTRLRCERRRRRVVARRVPSVSLGEKSAEPVLDAWAGSRL